MNRLQAPDPIPAPKSDYLRFRLGQMQQVTYRWMYVAIAIVALCTVALGCIFRG